MPRTTSDAVIEVLGANYGPLPSGALPSVTRFINTASLVIDQVVVCASNKGVVLSADVLEGMECWLAAHFYTQMDPLYASRSTGGASGSFRDQSYKEQALILDPTGCLNAILNKKRAGITWLGKDKAEQLTYDERNS